MQEDSTSDLQKDSTNGHYAAMQGWTRRERYILLLAALFTFSVSIVALVGSWQTGSNLTTYVQCQAEWNSFLHQALEARTNAGAEATAAMDNFIDAVAQAKSSEDIKVALAKYKEARANQIKTQHDNPLPPPPNEVCVI